MSILITGAYVSDTNISALPHGYKVGESVIISNTSGGPGNWNGSFVITSVSSNTFTYNQIDASGSASTLGQARVERIAMSNSGSKVILTDAISNKVSRITGSYIWDQAATFVLSSNTGDSLEAVQAGKIVRLLNIGSNTLPDSGGFVIFNYGRSNQEGEEEQVRAPG